jgi:hypothetical protein
MLSLLWRFCKPKTYKSFSNTAIFSASGIP